MSFLQPLLLAALPLVALPIIIHLINQRRYQTIRWGAMMFLLAANRMSRGYRAAAAMADHGIPDGRHRRPDLRDQPAARRGLAGAHCRRPPRYDDRPARSVPQHAGEQPGGRGLEAGNRPAAVGPHAQDRRLGPLDLDREHDRQAPRAGVDRRSALVAQHRGGQRLGRYSGNAAGSARIHHGQQIRPHRDLDLFRHPPERLERRERPLAGDPRRVFGAGAERAFPPFGLSAERSRQRVGACDRRAPAEDGRRGRAAGVAAAGAAE